jgi:hypothetical protein
MDFENEDADSEEEEEYNPFEVLKGKQISL